jgi:maleamate amidohydrolase
VGQKRQRLGFGRRPALLVNDFMTAYVRVGSPLYAPGVLAAVRESGILLECARTEGISIIHTRVRYDSTTFTDAGLWVHKLPALRCLVEGNPDAETCAEVMPRAGEVMITKNYASAFFGTSLGSMLTAAGVDTVILIGCSTSGCIRASAVDALQHGFRPIVVRECVGDRDPGPHEANLFDIDSKYGDVVSKAEVLEYLRRPR